MPEVLACTGRPARRVTKGVGTGRSTLHGNACGHASNCEQTSRTVPPKPMVQQVERRTQAGAGPPDRPSTGLRSHLERCYLMIQTGDSEGRSAGRGEGTRTQVSEDCPDGLQAQVLHCRAARGRRRARAVAGGLRGVLDTRHIALARAPGRTRPPAAAARGAAAALARSPARGRGISRNDSPAVLPAAASNWASAVLSVGEVIMGAAHVLAAAPAAALVKVITSGRPAGCAMRAVTSWQRRRRRQRPIGPRFTVHIAASRQRRRRRQRRRARQLLYAARRPAGGSRGAR